MPDRKPTSVVVPAVVVALYVVRSPHGPVRMRSWHRFRVCCAAMVLCCAADTTLFGEESEALAIRTLKARGAEIVTNHEGHAVEIWQDGAFTSDDAQWIEPLTHLEEVTLLDCRLNDNGFRHFAKLATLRVLCIHSPSAPAQGNGITNDALKTIGKLTQLKELSLCGMPIDDVGVKELRRLTHLEFLDLFGTELSNEGLPHLYSLRKLRTLNVRETQWKMRSAGTPAGITRDGAEAFQRVNSNCDVLY